VSELGLLLARAIEVTRRGLDCESPEATQAAVDERGALVERIASLLQGGATTTAHERHLASELQRLGKELLAAAWQPNADSFRWLAKRSEAKTEGMPVLRALAAS
jgi:hypothetical protein